MIIIEHNTLDQRLEFWAVWCIRHGLSFETCHYGLTFRGPQGGAL